MEAFLFLQNFYTDNFVCFFMLRSIAIQVLILFFMNSCKKDIQNKTYSYMQQDTSQMTVPADTSALKAYLALGDSYTIGQSVPEMARFPVQTVSMLLNDSIKFDLPEI